MPKTTAQKIANRKYRDKVYDQITIEVPKGKRDEYKAAAEDLKITFKALIQNGVEEFIARHAATDAESPAQVATEKLSADEKRLVEEFAKLPADVRKAITKIISAVNSSKGGGGNGNE